CDVYCDRFMDNCPGYYEDADNCHAFCELFPQDGEPNATQGNNVQCRIYHGNLPALGDPDLHCPHGSLTGGDVCGSYCEVYCDMVERNCDAQAVFPDRYSCMASCEAFPTDGDPVATAGNSVQCRIYHGGYPASQDPALHCPHTSTGGGGVCGSHCEGYCAQMMAHCPATYGDMAQCLTLCEAIPADGMWNDTAGNSLQCRTYHASFPAAGEPMTHCPHAGLTGGNVCGDYCEVYCDYIEDNCAAQGQFNDRDACMTACADYSTGGRDGDTSGDSVQCRIYHASYPASQDPALHCPHAGPDGAGVCVGDSTCERYCDAMLANCPTAYPDADACMAACGL
ncbi:MAG: hypothetical protein KC620_26330, partial [Myxococcales bacterium]|nr:hypothetical protein [Myxococcales bacterium]